MTDPRNLRIALARINRNRGRRTGGIDRVTVHHVLQSGMLEPRRKQKARVAEV